MKLNRRFVPNRDDSGSAMIIALIVMTVTITLSLAAATEAVHGASATALDRNQVQAISLAEAGVDHALSLLQGSTSLPCSTSSPTLPLLNLATTPVAGTVSVTLSYYDTFPPSGSPDTSCSGGVQGGTPQAVEITSIGQIGNSSLGKGTMEALARLTPYLDLTNALYANSFTIGNNATLYGQPGHGDNANVYVQNSSGGTVTCSNNAVLYGSLYVAQGAIALSNNCVVHGAVWANGNVSASNNTVVDGQISSTTGNISFSGSHAGGALAAGTITPSCPSPSEFGTCAAKATVGPVPSENFPQISYQASAWASAGYTIHDDSALSCSAATSDLGTFVPTVKSVFVAPSGCQLSYGNNASLMIGADLAVIAPGGLTATNNFTWGSSDGAVHTLYLIVPYTAPANCSSGNYDISFKNNASFPNLDAFIYTPCNLSGKNNPVSTGQLYVGQDLDIANNFSMTYEPETLPGGAGSAAAYNVAVSYERQLSH